MTDTPRYASYIRGKPRDAVGALEDDRRSMQERLWSAYVYSLSSLQQEWFPDLDAREWFDEIMASLTRYSEATEGAGSVPTTLWTMPDDEAEATASRIRRLADKYLA